MRPRLPETHDDHAYADAVGVSDTDEQPSEHRGRRDLWLLGAAIALIIVVQLVVLAAGDSRAFSGSDAGAGLLR